MQLSRHNERVIIRGLLNIAFQVNMSEEQFNSIVYAMAETLQQSYPKFNKNRFLMEIGVPPPSQSEGTIQGT